MMQIEKLQSWQWAHDEIQHSYTLSTSSKINPFLYLTPHYITCRHIYSHSSVKAEPAHNNLCLAKCNGNSTFLCHQTLNYNKYLQNSSPMCNCGNYFPHRKCIIHQPPPHSSVHTLPFVWFSFTFAQKALTFNVHLHYNNQDFTPPSANVFIFSHSSLFLIRCRGWRLSKEKFNLNTITLKNSQAFRLTTRQERCDGNERKFFVEEKLNIIAENWIGVGG